MVWWLHGQRVFPAALDITFVMHVYDILPCCLFCRYVREGSDRTRGDDITKFLSVELDATEARIRKLLQRHPYWCHVPLMTVRDTLDFLLNRGFTREQILCSIHALLYSRSVTQECWCTFVAGLFRVLNLSQNSGQKPFSSLMALRRHNTKSHPLTWCTAGLFMQSFKRMCMCICINMVVWYRQFSNLWLSHRVAQ